MLARALFGLSARSGIGAALLVVIACTGSEPLGPSGLEAPTDSPALRPPSPRRTSGLLRRL